MPDHIAIHRLTPADIPLLRELNRLFGEAFGEPDTYLAAPPDDAYLQALLGREHVVVLIAQRANVLGGNDQAGNDLVGGLAAYELQKFERARSEFYIYDLAVAEVHRRRGVATALIRRLQEIAAARGAWVTFVQADPVDAPAIALYEKLGNREEVLHFDIPVPGRA